MMTQERVDEITYAIARGTFDEYELSYIFKNRGEVSKISPAAFIDKTLWDIVELTVLATNSERLEKYMAKESHDVLMAWQNRKVLFSSRDGIRTMRELVDFLNELKEKHMITKDKFDNHIYDNISHE